MLLSTARIILTGVHLPPHTVAARVWQILVAWILDTRALWFHERRRLGDLCRVAYHAHVVHWQPRVMSYESWLRMGGAPLPALELPAQLPVTPTSEEELM